MDSPNRKDAQRRTKLSPLVVLRNGLFSMLYVLKKNSHVSPWLAYMAMLVKLLQMLLFTVYPDAAFNWSATILPLRTVTKFLALTGYVGAAQSAYFSVILFFIAFAWAAAFTVLAVWSVHHFSVAMVPSLPVLHALRFMASFSATIGFIPLLQALLSTFSCGNAGLAAPDYWVGLGFVCYEGAHLGLSILAVILAIVLVSLCVTYAFLFYDSHPLSSSLQAKHTGHVDAAVIMAKVLLVVLVETFPAAFGPAALTAVLLVSAVVLVSLLVYYMPYVHHSINQLAIGCATVFGYATVCLLICQLYPANDAAVVLYAGAPFAFASGSALAQWRREQVLACSPQQLRSPYVVHLWAHFTMQSAQQQAIFASDSSAARSDPATLDSPSKPDTTLPADFGSLSAEARMTCLRPLLSPVTLANVQQVLRDAGRRFSSSALMQVALGNYYAVYRGQFSEQAGHLSHAQRLGPPLDIAFLVYSASRVRDSALSDASSSDVMARVAFEKHLHVARHATVSTAVHLAAFYAELTEAEPDVAVLHKKASALAASKYAAETAFAALFAVDPLNIIALRLSASFGMITNNPDAAAAAAAEADRVEDLAVRDASAALRHRTTAAGPVLWSYTPSSMPALDSAAMVTVGCTGRDVGVIQSVNVQTCRMFGYTKVQLERRSINMLMPSAIADLHDDWIRRYMSSGEARALGSTIDVLAKHKEGHLLLAQMCIREMGVETGTPTLTAYFRPSDTNLHYILADASFRITEASLMSLALMGLSAAELKESGANLEAVIPDWAAVLADAKAGSGVRTRILRVVATVNASGRKGEGDRDGYRSTNSARNVFAEGGRTGSATNLLLAAAAAAMSNEVVASLQSATVRGLVLHVLAWKQRAPEQLQPLVHAPQQRATVPTTAGQSPNTTARKPTEEHVILKPALRNRRVSFDAPQGQAEVSGEDGHSDSCGSMDAYGISRPGDPMGASTDSPTAAQELAGLLFAPRRQRLRSPDASGTDDVTVPLAHAVEVSSPLASTSSSPRQLPREQRLGRAGLLLPGLQCPFRPITIPGATPDADLASARGLDDAESSSPSSSTAGTASPATVHRMAGSSGDSRLLTGSGIDPATPNSLLAPATPEGAAVAGEQRSVGSSKRSTGVRQHARLRRYVDSIRDRGLTLAPLRSIWLILLEVVSLNIVLAIVMTTVVSSKCSYYLTMLQYAQLADANMGNLYGIARASRESSMVSNGWANASTFDDGFNSLGNFQGYVDAFAATHQSIYQVVQGTPMEASFTARNGMVKSFTTADLVSYGAVNASYIEALLEGTQRAPVSLGDWDNAGGHVLIGWQTPASLLEMGVQYAASAKAVLGSVAATGHLDRGDPSLLFTLSNGKTGASMHDGMAGILPYALGAIVAAEADAHTVALSIYLTIVVCIVATVVFVLLPALRSLDRARDSVLSAFMSLPKPVLGRLRAQADAHVKRLRQSEDGEDDGDGSDSEGGEDDRLAGSGPQQQGSIHCDDQDLLDGEDDAETWEKLLDIPRNSKHASRGDSRAAADAVSLFVQSPSASAAPRPASLWAGWRRRAPRPAQARRSKDGAHHGWRHTAGRMLLFCLPLLAALICKTTVYATTTATLSKATPLAAAFVSACLQRQRFLELESDTAIALTTEGFPFEATPNLAGMYTALEGTQLANSVLAYGALPASPPLLDGQLAYPAPGAFPPQLQGSESAGYSGISSADAGLIRTAVLDDACPLGVQVADSTLNLTLAGCDALASGMLAQGLFVATQRVIEAAARLGQAKFDAVAQAEASGTLLMPTVPGSNYSFGAVLASHDFLQTRLLTVRLLAPLSGAFAQVYYNAAVAGVQAFQAFLVLFPAVFLTTTTAATLAFYRPMLQAMNEDVDRKRGLLLLLPPILLLRVPHLHSLVDELTEPPPSSSVMVGLGKS